MGKIVIDREKCKGCYLCVDACPRKSLCVDRRLNRRGAKPAKFQKGAVCGGCGICAIVCPDCCITVYKEAAIFSPEKR